jgi:hypothetical protein
MEEDTSLYFCLLAPSGGYMADVIEGSSTAAIAECRKCHVTNLRRPSDF